MVVAGRTDLKNLRHDVGFGAHGDYFNLLVIITFLGHDLTLLALQRVNDIPTGARIRRRDPLPLVKSRLKVFSTNEKVVRGIIQADDE